MSENTMESFGFTVVSDEMGMTSQGYSGTCSGSRSDCCARKGTSGVLPPGKYRNDDAVPTEKLPRFVDRIQDSPELWEKFLATKGGQVQY